MTFRKNVATKMDSARALGLMGFSGTRLMDKSTGDDPKEALNKALFNQMQALAHRKKEAIRKEKEEQKRRAIQQGKREPKKKSREEAFTASDDGYSNPYMSSMACVGSGGMDKSSQPVQTSIRLKTKEEKYAEDVLKLHEAYQFLMKKHVTNKTRQKMTHAVDTINQVKKLMGGAQSNSSEDGGEERTNLSGNEDEDGNKSPTDETAEAIPCGACVMIEALDDDLENMIKIE